MIGKTILHYQITEKQGEGGMGVVYKAEDTKLKRTVAIKFLPRQIVASEEERARFKVEVQSAASLNNPNIATIYATEEVEGDLFIVMEYVEGRELRDILGANGPAAAGPLPVDEILKISTQMAEGLETAHERGVVHGDIKSSNVIITDKGQAKIMDFGLAKVKGDQSARDTGIPGTAAYMSPEQAEGKAIDHRTDVWSFGVVLYEMLTGQLPFKGDDEQAVINSILHEEPESVKVLRGDTPAELTSILNKALAKNPQSRYAQVGEMLADLLAIRKNIGKVRAVTHSVTSHQPRRFGRLLATAIVLLLLVLAGYWITTRGGI